MKKQVVPIGQLVSLVARFADDNGSMRIEEWRKGWDSNKCCRVLSLRGVIILLM